MNSIVSPLVVTFILSYFVSSIFNEIFAMAIETVLCCYIADEEMFPPELRFAENELKHAISHSSNAAIEKGGFTKVQVRTFFMLVLRPTVDFLLFTVQLLLYRCDLRQKIRDCMETLISLYRSFPCSI